MMFMSLLVLNTALLDEAPVSVSLSLSNRSLLALTHTKCFRGSDSLRSKQIWDNVMLPEFSV